MLCCKTPLRQRPVCPFKYIVLRKVLVGCYGRKIHPVYSIQHIPKITKVRLCHLPRRKTDLKVEMSLGFLMKLSVFRHSLGAAHLETLSALHWNFIASMRETPLTLNGHDWGNEVVFCKVQDG